MNSANNLMGAVAPIITVVIVGRTHSFKNAFLVAGVVLMTGVAAFVFLQAGSSPCPSLQANLRRQAQPEPNFFARDRRQIRFPIFALRRIRQGTRMILPRV